MFFQMMFNFPQTSNSLWFYARFLDFFIWIVMLFQ